MSHATIYTGHGAANVTLGIPRLREIVMTASQKPKTPSMTMKIREGIPQANIDLFCKRASRVALSQVVENVIVRESPKVEGHARRTTFGIDIIFFPEEEYVTEYDIKPLDILNAFSTRFPLMFRREITNEMKKLDSDIRSQITDMGKGKKATTERGEDAGGEDEDEAPRKGRGDDEESEIGDGDADDEKRARQAKQAVTYESDEEEDVEDAYGEYDDAEIEAAFAEAEENIGNDSQELKKKKRKRPSSLGEEVNRVADTFISYLKHATSFEFTPTKCTFELEVSRGQQSQTRNLINNKTISSPLICRSSCLWALWNGLVVSLLFARFLASPIVSRLRMTVKKGKGPRSRSAAVNCSVVSLFS